MSDTELETLRRRKLQELKRQLGKKPIPETEKPQEVGPKEILNRFFFNRAWEVLNAAKAQYPEVAANVEKTLVKLIAEGKIRSRISGGELYGLFLRLGFRVRLQTHIRVLEHGKVKSLEEKIREETTE